MSASTSHLRETLLAEPSSRDPADVEECATWDVASEASGSLILDPATLTPSATATARAANDVGVWASLFTVLVSLPALLGSWCWPILLAGAMGAAASEASKQLAHAVSFGVNLAVLTNLAQMVFWKSHRRKGSRMNRHGPTALVLAAVPLAMLDQTRHVLQDGGVWTDSRMYRPGCAHEDVRCLSALGAACQVATYAGFACLIVGVSWSADLFRKARDGYRRARRGGVGDAA